MAMVDGDRTAERMSTVAVSRGLHALRYVSAGDFLDREPVAFVRPVAGAERDIQIISPPGQPPGVLSNPGSCLVIVAEQDGTLQIQLRGQVLNGPNGASFKLEPLQDKPALSRPGPNSTRGAESSAGGGNSSEFGFLAHIARQGDTIVRGGEWAAGPEAPAPIEGLEIRDALPEADVECQVLVAGEWSPWRSSSWYIGTRGRALPLNGLRLRLVGARAHEFKIEAAALFLGSPVLSRSGSALELISLAGSDPLVGLKLQVLPVRSGSHSPSSHEMKPPRVRVFRANA